MDFFTTALIISLILCAAGLIFRAIRGVRTSLESPATLSAGARLKVLLREGLRAFSPRRLPATLRAVIFDTLLQVHVLRSNPVRWVMHFLIFAAFTALVVMHAMDGVVSYDYFPAYEPTLDPYQFLRNLFGLLVLLGLAVAVARRMLIPRMKRVTGFADWFAIGLVGLIIISGIALEAVKIASPDVFDSMVDDYYPIADEEELAGLKAFWSETNGVAFAEPPQVNDELLALGAEVDDAACAACHSPTASAFTSRPLADGLAALGIMPSSVRPDIILWYVHVLLCFIGLALLPFTKFLHIVTVPVNLVLRPWANRSSAVGEKKQAGLPEPAEALRGPGMDACTHCGVCSTVCSVGPAYEVLGNPAVLPSEKLRFLDRYARGKAGAKEIQELTEGSHICTECFRCTQVCPSRIDLQDLWLASKRELTKRGKTVPHGRIDGRSAAEWAAIFRENPPTGPDPERTLNLTDNPESFWGCIQCTTCTSVCPVVAAASDPVLELDFTPQQIMNLMRMGLKDAALGARMVWNCTTCYKCQEHCPQGVQVADVLYELRIIAANRFRETGDVEQAERSEA